MRLEDLEVNESELMTMNDYMGGEELIKLARSFLDLTKQRNDSKNIKREDDPVDVIYTTKVDLNFLNEGGRRFIYLTSVGQGYHDKKHFFSQCRCIFDAIAAQLRCDKKILGRNFKNPGPFEVIVLIADSLQAYSQSERDDKTSDHDLDIHRPSQCKVVTKDARIRDEYIEAGNAWKITIHDIIHDMVNEIKTEFGQDVIDLKIESWSNCVDPCVDGKDFQSILCLFEKHLKSGLAELTRAEPKYLEQLKMSKVWSLRYVLEEAVGLHYRLYPRLFKPNPKHNETIYFGYPAKIGAFFSDMHLVVKKCCNELRLTFECPETQHVYFHNCSNDERIKSEYKNSNWKNPFLGLPADKYPATRESQLAHQDRQAVKYESLLKMRLAKIKEEESTYLLSEIDKYRELVSDVLDKMEKSVRYNNAVFLYQCELHRTALFKWLFKIQEKQSDYAQISLAAGYGKYNFVWNINDYFCSVENILNTYLAATKMATHNHRQHMNVVLKRLSAIVLQPTSPTLLFELLTTAYIHYLVDMDASLNISGDYTTSFFYCCYNLVRHHGVRICKTDGDKYELLEPSQNVFVVRSVNSSNEDSKKLSVNNDNEILHTTRYYMSDFDLPNPALDACDEKVKKSVKLLHAVRYIFDPIRVQDGHGFFGRKIPETIVVCREIVDKFDELFICMPKYCKEFSSQKIQYNECHPFGGFEYSKVLSLHAMLSAKLNMNNDQDVTQEMNQNIKIYFN
jgi:hypothetical protein